ncbi:MAG: hypothetical protein IIW33_00820 [Oscillospiraceae bacterium]|nr:hypothetical protein [Oscillospiraceae bacterium]
MEVQLQELIEQIKKDGVLAAETEAENIIAAAKKEAQKILDDAKAQSEKLLASAKAETEKMTKSSEDAIAQAGRNLLISFRESVTRELKAVTSEKVDAVYSSEALLSLIVKVVECWAGKSDVDDVAVVLNSDDLAKLENALLAALKERMLSSVTLKANDNFDGGFRIAVNGGDAYYDYSEDAVVDMLSNYLSPKVTQLLKEAK